MTMRADEKKRNNIAGSNARWKKDGIRLPPVRSQWSTAVDIESSQ